VFALRRAQKYSRPLTGSNRRPPPSTVVGGRHSATKLSGRNCCKNAQVCSTHARSSSHLCLSCSGRFAIPSFRLHSRPLRHSATKLSGPQLYKKAEGCGTDPCHLPLRHVPDRKASWCTEVLAVRINASKGAMRGKEEEECEGATSTRPLRGSTNLCLMGSGSGGGAAVYSKSGQSECVCLQSRRVSVLCKHKGARGRLGIKSRV
jgi:hypothetical protein